MYESKIENNVISSPRVSCGSSCSGACKGNCGN